MPATPLSEAGQVIEPSVSVPMARGASPAATAAPEPEDDPPALRSRAQGLPVRPPTADHPDVERAERMFAHSERLVVPRITAPASRSRRTSGASRVAGRPTRLVAPAVEGSPATSMLSFTRTGTPWRGPEGSDRSQARASEMAVPDTARTLRKAVGEPGASRAVIRPSKPSTKASADRGRRRNAKTSA